MQKLLYHTFVSYICCCIIHIHTHVSYICCCIIHVYHTYVVVSYILGSLNRSGKALCRAGACGWQRIPIHTDELRAAIPQSRGCRQQPQVHQVCNARSENGPILPRGRGVSTSRKPQLRPFGHLTMGFKGRFAECLGREPSRVTSPDVSYICIIRGYEVNKGA